MWPAYDQSSNSLTDALNRLRTHITNLPVRLGDMAESDLTAREPGKWSRKELLGHLIDSAINNLKRFTDAQFGESPYQLIGYNQDQLVVANGYQALPLPHLLLLWGSLNTQILYVAKAIPTNKLDTAIAFAGSDAAPKTLGWLIQDYVAHLEHHLKTLLYP